MKGGNKLFLFAGVGLALVAILLGITMSSGEGTADAKKQDAPSSKVTVVRLLEDIEAHQIIKAEMVEQVEMEATEASPDAVTDRAAVLNQAYAVPAVIGDVLLASFVESPGITSAIAPGMRAVSLRVDSQGSMSGLIVAGDYVDVVFEARINLRRVVEIQGIELEEDGPYQIKFKDDDSDDDSSGDSNEESQESDDNEGEIFPGTELAPYQGKDGSEFTALDAGDLLEPVAKMLVQDIKIIRVIQPGATYDGQGQQVQAVEGTGAADEDLGQLIVEVTPQQAEAIAFMQSEHHAFSVAVRGEDDHAFAETSGITFQILMSDGTWSMPWPEPIVAEAAREQRGTPVAIPTGPETDFDEETT